MWIVDSGQEAQQHERMSTKKREGIELLGLLETLSGNLTNLPCIIYVLNCH